MKEFWEKVKTVLKWIWAKIKAFFAFVKDFIAWVKARKGDSE